jgi:hypothetical protein
VAFLLLRFLQQGQDSLELAPLPRVGREIALQVEKLAAINLRIRSVSSDCLGRPWQAYIDGKPRTLWRANFAFQALEVPAGSHEVRLVYHEPWLPSGVGLSAAGLAGLVVLWRRRADSPPPHRAAGL